ncbi:MAG: hypothetical protein OHK005_13770 [Candidatus Methylacidiphilales bacterium]
MIGILWRALVLAAAIFVAAHLVPGLRFDSYGALAWASLILALLNTFVRPVLVLLSLGWVVVTLGLFLVFLNALLLWLTAKIVPGFHVDGFWAAFFGAILVSLVSGLLGMIGRTKVQSKVTVSGRSKGSRPPEGKGPIIDI